MSQVDLSQMADERDAAERALSDEIGRADRAEAALAETSAKLETAELRIALLENEIRDADVALKERSSRLTEVEIDRDTILTALDLTLTEWTCGGRHRAECRVGEFRRRGTSVEEVARLWREADGPERDAILVSLGLDRDDLYRFDTENGPTEFDASRIASLVDDRPVPVTVREMFVRSSDGNINNCALINTASEEDCQICHGRCPDLGRFEQVAKYGRVLTPREEENLARGIPPLPVVALAPAATPPPPQPSLVPPPLPPGILPSRSLALRALVQAHPAPPLRAEIELVAPPTDLATIPWTEEQRDGLRQILEWAGDPVAGKFFKLTGAAGTGKTTALRALAPHFKRAVWSAMTGKAAVRMREAAGLKTTTTHSALYLAPREIDNAVERRVDLIFDDIKPVDEATLIVDEASMMDAKMFADLEASNYDKVLLVGDWCQLPPVEDSNYSAFTDLPGPHLTEVKRAAGAVVLAATRLRETDEIPSVSDAEGPSRYDFECWDTADDAFLSVIESYLADPHDHVVLTWKNDNRMHFNRTVRRRIGFEDALPQPGEPVVVCRNSPKQRLMNGDMMRVREWLNDGPTFEGINDKGIEFAVESRYCRVYDTTGLERAAPDKEILVLLGGDSGQFDGRMPYVGLANWKRAEDAALAEAKKKGTKWAGTPMPLTYGYCLTAHKAQGSQYRRVTTYVPGDLRNKRFNKKVQLPDGTMRPFSTLWIYTAISRATQRSTLVVSR